MDKIADVNGGHGSLAKLATMPRDVGGQERDDDSEKLKVTGAKMQVRNHLISAGLQNVLMMRILV